MAGKVKFFSFLIFLFFYFHCARGLALADDLPVEFHTNASLYGLQVVRRGELLTFSSYWSELIIINLPNPTEYDDFLNSIDAYCRSMSTKQFEVYENLAPSDIKGIEQRAEWLRKSMQTRCETVKKDITKTVRDLIEATFKFSVPEPPAPDTRPIPMITNYDKFDFSNTDADKDDEDDSSKYYRFSSMYTDGKSDQAPVVPMTQQSVLSSTEGTTVSTKAVTEQESSTLPLLTTVSSRTSTEIALNETGTERGINDSSNIFRFESDSNDTYEYHGQSVSQKDGTVRKKREAVTLSILAIAAIAALFSTSAAGVAVALTNKQRIHELEDKVRKLVEISESQDREATNIRDWLMGATRYSSEKFNETGNTLNGMLRLQKLFSLSINDTASSLREYSTGDSLANSLFLNLHEEADFLNRVTSVLESVRRVTRNYELGIMSLQNNQLSPSFVNHKNLKKILYKVRDALPKGYSLGLGMGKLEDYYFYKLATHTKVNNQLFLRLIIPLSTNGIVIPTSLFTPVFHVVPLPRRYQEMLQLPTSKNFYRINEREHFWECKRDKFISLIDRTHLNCQGVGWYIKCTRYEPTPTIVPSNCIKLLMNGNFDPNAIFSEKTRACRPLMMSPDDYTPIRLQEDEYVLHGSEYIKFRKVQGNRSIPIEIDEDTPMKLVRLGNGEQLEVNGNLLPAPIFQEGSKVTLNMSSGVQDIIFVSPENRIHLPSPSTLKIPAYILNDVEFKPIDNSFPEALMQKLAEDNNKVRERIESYNKTFLFDSLARKTHMIERMVLKHMQTFLLILVAIYCYKSRSFLIFTTTYFVVIQNGVESAAINPIPVEMVSFFSFWSEFPHPDYEIVFQIALLAFIIFNVLFKNFHNKVMLHKANGYIINKAAEFNVSLTFEVEKSLPCYLILETINIKYPLYLKSTNIVDRTIRCEPETNHSNYKISRHGIFTLSDPFYIFGLSELGETTFALAPFEVTFDVKNVSWTGNQPLTLGQRQGGSCSILVTRNPYFEPQTSM